jgi:hypothetical protein
VISLSKETALSVASLMMGGMLVTELDDLSKSAISELGNMIMGNTATILQAEGSALRSHRLHCFWESDHDRAAHMKRFVFRLSWVGTISLRLMCHLRRKSSLKDGCAIFFCYTA